MANQLALSARPRTFSQLVGQNKIVKSIRGHLTSGRTPKAWMFYGPKGSGKTTIARIMSVSFHCTHQDVFGEPCKECRKNKAQLPIYELNCSFVSKADEVRQFVSLSDYEVAGSSGPRVFIFDEAHDLSALSQDVLLKYFEDSADCNIWIICSTRPDKINETLRSRCLVYAIKPLGAEDTLVYVKSLLTRVKSDFSSEALADALVEAKVSSPRLIANAVEKYLTGIGAEEAAAVEGFSTVSTKSLVRNVVRGDWNGVVRLLRNAPPSEARLLRASVVGYLREILFDCSELDERTQAVYESIRRLCQSSFTEDANQIALLAAELAALCKVFSNYKF